MNWTERASDYSPIRGRELVSPSMLGRLRDVPNTEADWRKHRSRLGYPTMTSHALRKTCATALDVQGLSARAIAEYLGHKQPLRGSSQLRV